MMPHELDVFERIALELEIANRLAFWKVHAIAILHEPKLADIYEQARLELNAALNRRKP